MSTLSKITTELGLMLTPLQEGIASKPAFTGFMRQLGWQADDIPQPIKDTADSLLTLENLIKNLAVEEPGPDTILQIKTAITSVINAIKAVENAPTALIPAALLDDDFQSKFPEQLIAYLLCTYVYKNHPKIAFILQTLGVIKISYVAQSGNRLPYTNYSFDFADIPDALQSPAVVLKNAFGWGTDSFDYEQFIQIVENLLCSLGLDVQTGYINKKTETAIQGDLTTILALKAQVQNLQVVFFDTYGPGNAMVTGGLNFLKLRKKEDLLPGFAILPYFNGSMNASIPLGTRVVLTITSEADFAGGIGILARPNKGIQLITGYNQSDNPSQANVAINIKAEIDKDRTDPHILLGSADGSRVQFKNILLNAGISLDNKSGLELFSEFRLKEFKFILDTTNSDGFIQKILPIKHAELDADLTLGISNIRGIYFSGSGNLEINIPTHIELGPVDIQNLLVNIIPSNGKLTTSIALSLKATLGPITVVVNNLGINGDLLFPPESKFLDFSLGFKPPSGAGLSVDAGGIKGGGILNFDPENKEYFGALELEFKDLFSLKAFGIINTRMPDGSEGFSLLIIITAEFTPVQLGFGFTLNGVGGLLGVNRTTKVEVLKEGIKTNAIESILFPQNIVANINRIVSDIKQVFPPQNDHYLICPMGKIGWGTPTIITLELGILIEIPASGFIILGVLKALLPQEDSPILKLQVNFLGVIDFENKSISFDASLYDSKILTFTLSGDMALRLAFGDKPVFILSVGGFHPAFKEVPADLQNMKRITLSLYDGANARIIIQTYFAVTSNTAQFGAKAELFAGSEGGFNIYGFVNYDVLFQFSPFKFIADLAAGVALRHGSSVIMSVNVSGELSGPTPWDAKGEAGVSFFFFSVSVPFHVTWGDPNSEAGKEIADILLLLTNEINNSSNWKAAIPDNNKLHVSIRAIEQSDTLIAIHPFGILTFSERLVPLELDINKFGNQLPKDANHFEIKTTDETLDTDYAMEQFAPANFLDMSDDEKLSRPSFEPMKSGFKITGSEQLQTPQHVADKKVDYEFSYLGKKKKPKPDRYKYPGSFFKAHTKASAACQSSISFLNNRDSINAPESVGIEEEKYVLANVSDMKLYSSEMTAGSYTETVQHYKELIKAKPELKDHLQVLSKYELNLN